MYSREHYQADGLMKSIKARSGNPAPSAMVVSLPPLRRYRASEGAAAQNAAGVLALPYTVSASTPTPGVQESLSLRRELESGNWSF